MAEERGRIEDTVRDIVKGAGIDSRPRTITAQGADSTIVKPNNEDAEWIVNTSDGSILVTIHSAAEDEFEHHLGRIPEGFKVRDIREFAQIKRGSTAWTANKIYLISDADVQCKITVF